MRVNGLYGHVRSNDLRSLALFAGFVAAFHLLAALALLCRSRCSTRSMRLSTAGPAISSAGCRHLPSSARCCSRCRWPGTCAPSGPDGVPLRRRSRRTAALPHRRAAGDRGGPAGALCRRDRQPGDERLRLRHPPEGRRAGLHARPDRAGWTTTSWPPSWRTRSSTSSTATSEPSRRPMSASIR